MTITVELCGLEIFGHHGVEDRERRDGQPFVYDIWFDVSDTTLTDRIEDAVDYVDVVDCVREVSAGRSFQLLESLANAVAREVLARFAVERVRVRVRKPQVDLPVDYSAATVELP